MPKEASLLPFAIGTATQHRPNATTESQNSQDCANVIIDKSVIVGVVADGCTGTHPVLRSTSRSNNEVGSKLLSYLISHEAKRLAAEGLLGKPTVFAQQLSQITRSKLEMLTAGLAGKKAFDKELFIFDFLMTTVLGMVVTADCYVIFHAGDGLVALNGHLQSLESEAGLYMANGLLGPASKRKSKKSLAQFSLKVLASGPAETLDSAFIATDGLCQLAKDHPRELEAFIGAAPDRQQIKNGFDFLLKEFRGRLAWNPDIQLRLDDDATFVLLRRIKSKEDTV